MTLPRQPVRHSLGGATAKVRGVSPLGSGLPRDVMPKGTVEECLVLSAGMLQRARLLVPFRCTSSRNLTLTDSTAWQRTLTIGIDVYWFGALPRLRLHHGDSDTETYCVKMTATLLPWDRVRWWFICPLVVNGWACGRRVAKLYLPPGELYFGCRRCYDLTYQSTRKRRPRKKNWRAWLDRMVRRERRRQRAQSRGSFSSSYE